MGEVLPGSTRSHDCRNVFAQDNQSAMKLDQNGRKSCGQKSRHIDIRYFFTKDRMKSDNITIQYCPNEQMLADFFTKPLQGALFLKFKRVLMGLAHVDTLSFTPSTTTEERVERNEKDTKDEKDTVVAKESSIDKDSGTWVTVPKRTKKVRVESHITEPQKKPTNNRQVPLRGLRKTRNFP